jgi:anti-anti-sigma factor
MTVKRDGVSPASVHPPTVRNQDLSWQLSYVIISPGACFCQPTTRAGRGFQDYREGGCEAMQITTTLGPVTVLSIYGAIDSATYFDLVKECDALLAAGHNRLVLDLSDVDFVSSGGLVALQTVAVRAVSHDGKMVLCGVGPEVSKILATAGFDKLLDIFPDDAAAKASFG